MTSINPSCLLLSLTLSVAGVAGAQEDVGDTPPIELDPIQVIITKPLKTEISRSVAPASIIEGEELRRITRQNIGETLATEPGVHADSFGPGSARPNIRGLERQRVKVMENGIDAMDASTVSADHAVGIESSNARRIEILRGPETLAYGSSAVGGAVNVINDRIPTEVDEPFTGFANVEYGSNANEQAYNAELSGRVGRIGWHIDAAHREANDQEIPGFAEADRELDGHHEEENGHEDAGHDGGDGGHGEDAERGIVENSAFNTDSVAGGLAWTSDRVELGFSISHLDSQYGVPGHGHGEEEGHGHDEAEGHGHAEAFGHDEEEEEENVTIDLDQTRYDFLANFLDPFRGVELLRFRLGINDYEHVELEGDEIGTEFENDELEGRIELVHRAVAGFTGALGLQAGDRDFSAIGEEAFVPPNETERIGVFWVGSRPLSEDVTLDLGARYEDQDITADPGGSASHDAVSASIGAAWELASDRFLTVNLQRVERNPAAEELFSDGVHVATRSFEIGDPDLDTESSVAIDIGFRGATDTLDWQVNAFYNDYDDFMFLNPTGREAEGFPILVYEQADAEFRGFEAALGADLVDTKDWSAYGRVFTDYTRGKLSDGRDLPRIPPWRIGGELAVDYGRWRIAADVIHHADQDKVAEFETSTESFTTVGFDVDYRLATTAAEWTLFLRGTNITDEKGRRHVSRLKDQVPIRGRALTLGVRANW